jgi:hypothetical protein
VVSTKVDAASPTVDPAADRRPMRLGASGSHRIGHDHITRSARPTPDIREADIHETGIHETGIHETGIHETG